ncbi:MAG: hypothetical protein RR490_07495, partial [Niameybacter sp.]
MKIGEVSSFYADGGKIADIEITEGVIGALAETAKTVNGKEVVELRVELESSEFEFNKGLTVKKDRGFGTGTITPVAVDVDKDEMTIYIAKENLKGTEKGRLTLTDMTVKANVKAPTTGDLNVTVVSDAVEEKEHKVATIA